MKDTRNVRVRSIVLCLSLSLFGLSGATIGSQPNGRTVIAAATLLDGRGGVVRNARVVVSDGRIIAVDPSAAPVDVDLGRATLMPGWIDTHVHLTWHFDDRGKSVSGGEPLEAAEAYAAENARVTLEAGFTTVQSVGAAAD